MESYKEQKFITKTWHTLRSISHQSRYFWTVFYFKFNRHRAFKTSFPTNLMVQDIVKWLTLKLSHKFSLVEHIIHKKARSKLSHSLDTSTTYLSKTIILIPISMDLNRMFSLDFPMSARCFLYFPIRTTLSTFNSFLREA